MREIKHVTSTLDSYSTIFGGGRKQHRKNPEQDTQDKILVANCDILFHSRQIFIVRGETVSLVIDTAGHDNKQIAAWLPVGVSEIRDGKRKMSELSFPCKVNTPSRLAVGRSGKYAVIYAKMTKSLSQQLYLELGVETTGGRNTFCAKIGDPKLLNSRQISALLSAWVSGTGSFKIGD